MTEFEDEYEYETYYEEPAAAEEQLTEYFYADPVAAINAVAGAAAEIRAQQIVQQTGSHIQAIEGQYASSVASQSGAIALNRLTELYGAEFEQAKPAIAEYIGERPYLVQADFRDPHVTFDVLHSAFENVKSEVQREKNRTEWDRIKNAGGYEYGDGRS